MILGVQDNVFDAPPLEGAREAFRLVDGGSADQNRPPQLVHFLDFVCDGLELLSFRPVDDVWILSSNEGLIGGDNHHVQFINLSELSLLGFRRSRHSRQLVVHAEVVLKSDRGQCLVLALDLDSFLGFQRLVQTIRVAASGHQATGKLIHNHHLSVLDHVVDIAAKKSMGFQSLLNVMDQIHV